MQQGQARIGGGLSQSQSQSQSQCVEIHPAMSTDQQMVEAASPISSRPPATAATPNMDQFMRISVDHEAADDESDRGGGGGGGASGNRWPRQETLVLLKIRSEMDAAFRDATVKGPLWEDVARKLASLGYNRNAKKCREKFENVHKYYKRTKEGRSGRQDGKSYKFFSELEALYSSTNVSTSAAPPMLTTTTTTTTAAGLDISPVSVGIPMSSSVDIRSVPPNSQQPHSVFGIMSSSSSMFHQEHQFTVTANPGRPVPTAPAPTQPVVIATNTINVGVSFSSNSSSSPSTNDDEELSEPSNTTGNSLKRKRYDRSSSTTKMMDFFEGLMKQVMQKQESMHERFLEAIMKREQDRMIREEAWKREEAERLAREHKIIAEERAISASRDATIFSFLQKISGQAIQLPVAIVPNVLNPVMQQPSSLQSQQQPVPIPIATPQPIPTPTPTPVTHLPPSSSSKQQANHNQNTGFSLRHEVISTNPSQVVHAIPKQEFHAPSEVGAGESSELSSSRWPKTEVLALINLRSGLEAKYQETGPKGPLWEEISAGMQRIGYKRNAKRCKEKWENINKYFKKVKESSKKRPQDAKTCPYFHQLDELYQRKIVGGSGSFSNQNPSHEQTPTSQYQEMSTTTRSEYQTPATEQRDKTNVALAPQLVIASESKNITSYTANVVESHESLTGSLFGEGNKGTGKKPEDIVREIMEQQRTQQQQHQKHRQPLMVDEYDSDDLEEDDCEEIEDEGKMDYRIEFQRKNTRTSNGGGKETPSFVTMAQ